MTTLVMAVRTVYLAVFLTAGVSKLLDVKGSRESLIQFGVPAGLASPLKWCLPVVELAISFAFVLGTTAWWSFLAAFALLAIFDAAIVANLTRGRKPNCHCFGQLYSAPVGWSTVIRNACLACIALGLVAKGKHSLGPNMWVWFGGLSSRQREGLMAAGILTLAGAAFGWCMIGLLRQNGSLLLRLEKLESNIATLHRTLNIAQEQPTAEGLPINSLAPDFSLPALNGEILRLKDLLERARSYLIVFSHPGCGPCKALWPSLREWSEEYKRFLTFVLISSEAKGPHFLSTNFESSLIVLVQRQREVAEAYKCYGTPAAVLISRDGRLTRPMALGADAISELVTTAVADISTQLNQPEDAFSESVPRHLPDSRVEQATV